MKCPKCNARIGMTKQKLATDTGFASGVICYIGTGNRNSPEIIWTSRRSRNKLPNAESVSWIVYGTEAGNVS
jgi:hypothetical protein